MFRTRAAAAILLATSLALTACGGGGDDADEGADAKTLTLWHYEGPNSAMGIAWNKSIEIFKKDHPGVEVKFEEKGFEQIQQNAQMILNSDSAPDLMEYNKGNATAGLLSKQGLLTDLSEQATKRGWDTKLSPSLQTTAKYDEDGIMGSGKFYGVPNYGEYVMVYYNKALFDKYKLAVPTTFEEFTKVMDTFVQNKVTPLAVGGAEYPAQQIFYELALSKSDRAFVDDYQLYKNKVDFKGPQLTYGAQTFADWVSKGYISKDSAGIKAEDMGVSFTQGKFPILFSGSWWYGRFAEEIKDFEWGTFLFPGNNLHPGSSGNLWVVPEKSKAKALAYDFIDITMSPEIQALLGNSGGVPVAADVSQITDPKNKELVETFNKISGSDGLAFYPDWPAPGYYDVLVAGVQGLINGSKTPDAFLDEIAKPYNENLADLGK
ncbi:raffinose/stachyose/melibiose transport system substrate-binding protein [Actinoplanes lutulentus]|uniref:Raffinose/stachyose/melibiose transport system substrate-binding protein n=1 Tax=Actinoplanes lutulentus TaxID=1287878 RepID=A0A327Z227_9ACTN|nr:extracellular solute-binding protein [Actinoplanes lutulentus]MBB2948690.1 raffinose/stachyose/melibiose transport system substrate-binding protein [Actinoplanes lutulentus]RAK27939.1 raffinose/stachyose/melibiose transport system substrate-binding protein [Actinoplanes lutulentus]